MLPDDDCSVRKEGGRDQKLEAPEACPELLAIGRLGTELGRLSGEWEGGGGGGGGGGCCCTAAEREGKKHDDAPSDESRVSYMVDGRRCGWTAGPSWVLGLDRPRGLVLGASSPVALRGDCVGWSGGVW